MAANWVLFLALSRGRGVLENLTSISCRIKAQWDRAVFLKAVGRQATIMALCFLVKLSPFGMAFFRDYAICWVRHLRVGVSGPARNALNLALRSYRQSALFSQAAATPQLNAKVRLPGPTSPHSPPASTILCPDLQLVPRFCSPNFVHWFNLDTLHKITHVTTLHAKTLFFHRESCLRVGTRSSRIFHQILAEFLQTF